MEPPALKWEPAPTQMLPPEPPTPLEPPVSSGEEGPGPTVRVHLSGETVPRTCWWDPEDLTMIADLDEAVGGITGLDMTRLWHMLALFWVTSNARHDMNLREFGRRFPWGGAERSANLTKGAGLLWRSITM